MNTIIETLETGIADLVCYNVNFTESYTQYVEQANKSSKEYSSYDAEQCITRAGRYTKMAIDTAKDLGLDPSKVCKDCINFAEAYKKYV